MKYLLITLGLLLLGACEFGTPEPTLVEDIPKFSKGEATAFVKNHVLHSVQEFLKISKDSGLSADEYQPCMVYLTQIKQNSLSLRETYLGDGVWRVYINQEAYTLFPFEKYKSWRHTDLLFSWKVYETTQTVENTTTYYDGDEGKRYPHPSNCL